MPFTHHAPRWLAPGMLRAFKVELWGLGPRVGFTYLPPFLTMDGSRVGPAHIPIWVQKSTGPCSGFEDEQAHYATHISFKDFDRENKLFLGVEGRCINLRKAGIGS